MVHGTAVYNGDGGVTRVRELNLNLLVHVPKFRYL
eukprot:SAG31_NODE_2637_length_5336_cov_2.105977_4_plen_35_part_00